MLTQGLSDASYVLGLLIVRVGVPLAITLAVGIWLERKLQPQEYAEQAARTQARLQVRMPILAKQPLHCWEIKGCDPAAYSKCPAFARQDLPCWLALQVAGIKIDRCVICELYQPQLVSA
jgi:hypothetical protein